MRVNTIIATICLFAMAAAQTYQLVWSDEFNGNSLDQSKWTVEQNCDGGGNAELQCYTNQPSNIAVTNGSLVITAIPQNYGGKGYTSGRINTQAKAAWKYGRIDFSAKLPNGIYLWPALWMMPRDSVYGGWAASGEIDIVESRSTQNTQESTLHYGGAWPNNVYQGSGPQTMSFDTTKDYHLYSAIWTPAQIQFLVDGNVYYTQTLQKNFWSGAGNNPYTANGQPFDQYFYIIINLAIGGNFFGGNANSLSNAQATAWANPNLYVDYVRVYQLTNSAVAVAPAPAASNSGCATMFAGLTCRTASEDPTQVDANSVSNSRGWLCSTYPQFCTAINSGGQYAGCNSVEQLSYAMNGYYTTFGPSQGNGACNFGGVGQIITGNAAASPSSSAAAAAAPSTSSAAAATPASSASSTGTSCSTMFSSSQCRTATSDPTQVDASAVSNSRSWLCSNYPQYCTAINSGGQYSSCNSVQQLSYAMTQYYNAVGASQGPSACNFGGLAALYSTSGAAATSAAAAAAPTSSAAAATPASSASSSSSQYTCARAGYCPSTLCACNGACYDLSQYCCKNNVLTTKSQC